MVLFYLSGRPLLLSLFYPRWLLDSPAVVRSWQMSSSSNSVVVAIEVDSQESSKASKASSLLSSPDLQPKKLGISKKIPGRTSVMPEGLGKNNNPGFSPPKASRYYNNSAQLIIDSAAKAVETLRSLPAGQKEAFASGFHDLMSKLQARTSEMLASRQAMPAKLPPPLP
jgi:hypothetical protein